jgi:catechol 2,3-dioxygenase-like lactoylglutathione lyase family enzyme
MVDQIETLLRTYEQGRIDRRQLLGALLAAVAAPASAQSAEAIFRGQLLNHVTVGVSDVAASKAFYLQLLGATVQKELSNQVDLRIGDSFITLLSSSQSPAIQHFCVGVASFNGETGLAELQRRQPQTKPRLVTNELDQQQLILRDPDGVTVEIADMKYRL